MRLTEKLIASFEETSRHIAATGTLTLVVLSNLVVVGIAVLDATTGYEFSFAIFYLLPIMTASFFVGWKNGVLTALLSGAGWYLAEAFARHPYQHLLAIYWNTSVRLGIFVLVALIMARLRTNLDIEKAQRERLAELNDLKNQFIGIAAHDLRTPLAVIKMYAQFLEEKQRSLSQKRQAEFLGIILTKTDFMLNMVADILDISAIESGKLVLRMSLQDYLGFVDRHVGILNSLAEKKGIEIRLEGREIPPMCFDKEKIEQVLDNLIMNALKFSPPRTTITVSVTVEQSRVVTRVADQGTGISPGELQQVFAPFSRTSVGPLNGEKGAGLGLAIAKKIVEAHHGEIGVTSDPGKGSVFFFALPLSSG